MMGEKQKEMYDEFMYQMWEESIERKYFER